jgi:hypothetical protein
MFLTSLALILVPVGLGAVLCACGIKLVDALTGPQRNRRRLMFTTGGACGLGFVGFVASGVASFAWGLIPLFGNDTGNQPAVAMIMVGGTLLFGCAGAWLGAAVEGWLARNSSATPAVNAR